MTLRSFLTAAVLALLAACTSSAQSCTDHFAGGEAPLVTNPNLAKKTTLLCYEGYAVLYSGISRTPLWAAEHLTVRRIEAAGQLKRKNAFHVEPKVPRANQSQLEDYKGSGYDRGHMAPNGDMPTEQAQYESFSLANIIPQHPKNNQILWEGVETATRALVRDEGELYVVTGPLFEGSELERLNGRVLVPTAVYKAIYVPGKQQAGAYVTPNTPGMAYQTLSIADLERRIGITVFPKLAPESRATKMALPVPTPHGQRGGRNKPVEVAPPDKE